MLDFLSRLSQTNPFIGGIVLILIIVVIIMLGVLAALFGKHIFAFLNKGGKIKVGEFEAALAKQETVKTDDKNAEEKKIAELRIKVEENTRSTITRQMATINPFIESLRPVFTKIVYSLLMDAQNESLGIDTEIELPLGYRTEEDLRKVETRDNSEEVKLKSFDEIKNTSGYYKTSELNRYNRQGKTRLFPNLVTVTVSKIITDLENTILTLLVNNNIGRTKGEIRSYVDAKKESIIGIVRNDLCEAYNSLSDKSLFDTKKYWGEVGIYYPEDWLTDKVYFLFKNCMKIRYSDFEM